MHTRFPTLMAAALALCLGAGALRSHGDQTDRPGPLRVGLARADITPEGPVWMRGFAARKKPSEGVHRNIQAQCIVFDNGQTRLAVVALDLCALSYHQLRKLREAAEASGIPQQHLMVNCSHSHYGPHMGSLEPHEKNLEHNALFTERTQPLLAAAVADLQPAVLDYTVGGSTMAINRRQLNEDGKCTGMRPEPRKQIDPDVPILRVLSDDGRVRAVLFGYACHPTATPGASELGYMISTGYPGYARDWVAAAYPDAQATFLQGCGGDIKPRAVLPTGRFGAVLVEPGDLVAALGYELGRAVVAALAVPPSPVPADRPADPRDVIKSPVPLGGVVELVSLPSKEDPQKMAQTPFHMGAWRIGDVYIFGSQGEVLSNIGLRIKRELAGLRVWTNGYTHWGGGYVPDAASYPEGGYEINMTAFAPQAEDIVVGAAIRLINKLQTSPVHVEPIPAWAQ
jgi:neutral ceramidase